jgi:hypothetical protein
MGACHLIAVRPARARRGQSAPTLTQRIALRVARISMWAQGIRWDET